MIGIDTNILVRLHIKDNEEQYRKSLELIENCTSQNLLFISNIVLIEWCWVLGTSYKVPKRKIIQEIEYYINAGDVLLQNQELCRNAIVLYRESSADFSDCLIGVLNKISKCDTTYTFDKKAAKLPSFSLLK